VGWHRGSLVHLASFYRNVGYLSTSILCKHHTVGTFHTKGWTNFFLVRFLLFMIKIMFFNVLRDSWPFFWQNLHRSKFRPKLGYIAPTTSREKKYKYSEWFMIAICGLHQLLVWSLEISSRCKWYLSSDPLPSCTLKIKKSVSKQTCHQKSENFVQVAQPGAPRFFFVGKRRPWQIIWDISETRSPTEVWLPVHQSWKLSNFS
jgi:hypothetical protein